MSPTATKSKYLTRYGLAAAASALAVAGVLYGISRGARKETTAAACPLTRALVGQLAPLAHGEVAALNVADDPDEFPDVSFLGPDGQPRRLSQFRGRTVLLNLWATWCVPCRQEMPALDTLQAKLGGPRFEVVAVDVDTARLDHRKPFLKRAGIRSLTFYADPTGQILRSLKQAGPVIGLPTSFLIGPDGCRLGSMLGPANWSSTDAVALIGAATAKPRSKG